MFMIMFYNRSFRLFEEYSENDGLYIMEEQPMLHNEPMLHNKPMLHNEPTTDVPIYKKYDFNYPMDLESGLYDNEQVILSYLIRGIP